MDTREKNEMVNRLRGDERGAVVVIVAFALFALIALLAFTIDLGKQLRATAEAQATADAAALAGAGVLATTPGAQSLARAEAVAFARQNTVMGDPVDIDPAVDVTFPGNDSIRVVVRRTSGSPDGRIAAIFGPFLGIDSLSVTRDAMARVTGAGTAECALPIGIPDRWWEEPGSPWSESQRSSEDDEWDSNDRYVSPLDENANDPPSGYTIADKGTQLELWVGGSNPQKYTPSWWGPWHNTDWDSGDLSGAITAEDCGTERWLLTLFNTVSSTGGARPGQVLKKGFEELIAQDPNARWQDGPAGCDCVVNSEFPGQSPRERPMPLYNPSTLPPQPGNRGNIAVDNWMGVFVESAVGNVVTIRINSEVGGMPTGAPAANSLVRAIQLVE